MSATAPAPSAPPSTDEDAGPQRPCWRRWLKHPWLRTAIGLAVLGAILGGLVAFDRLGDSDDRVVTITGSEEGALTSEAGLGALDGRSPEVGKPAPQFALRDSEGNVRRLSDYQGQAVWINFWATWCGPCERELPDIQGLAAEFQDEGLVVLAVNFMEPTDRALAFWDELDLDLPILLDSGGDVSDQYRLRGLPDSFFIDRDGVLRALQIGFLTEDEMREKLAEVGLE